MADEWSKLLSPLQTKVLAWCRVLKVARHVLLFLSKSQLIRINLILGKNMEKLKWFKFIIRIRNIDYLVNELTKDKIMASR